MLFAHDDMRDDRVGKHVPSSPVYFEFRALSYVFALIKLQWLKLVPCTFLEQTSSLPPVLAPLHMESG